MSTENNKGLWYLGENHTVDMVVFNESFDKVLLIQRSGEPFKEKWALPGGFVDSKAKKGELFRLDKETPKQAALRELKEETVIEQSQLKMDSLKAVGFFDDPKRDPRNTDISRAVSWGFMVVAQGEPKASARSDAKDVRWVRISDIQQGKVSLAFDHIEIVQCALKVKQSLDLKEGYGIDFVVKGSVSELRRAGGM